ncbi:hypothetical protein ACFQFC_39980 [Amorphoplanes digitatis]|uniref:Uncharacterized protein n=1 Tax=Actinoplanes digitatis TaxID=1868 RepID=A0A7W7HX25_9ACTN|nr:hypothetical protein [Actinoplanes digitatis]MBB4762354.1 hypothetical protein [Actinoplanes digitatis]GID92524.1 hypothetical protein Adi01nite_19360 [Actinoplanes digitatis]
MTAPTQQLLGRADGELMRLEAAAAAVASNLVDLDDNTARKDLDRGPLTGRTAAAWADATEALTQLWDGYRMLTALITAARAARDQRRFTDTEKAAYVHQVLGRSITLSTRTVPLAQRGLLGAGQVSTSCSPAELLAAMEAAFKTAVDVATRAGEVWHRLMPEAATVASSLSHLRTLTRSATLDEADRRLGDFTSALATDPLGCDETALAAVRALLDRADAERTSAGELREALTQRLTDAHALADQLAEAARAAAAAEQSVAGRFADTAVATAAGPDLRPDLAALDALAAAGHWALISPRLADWTRRARERLDALRGAAARNAAMLGSRNELRGRLDAYQAKAGRRGLAEDTVLAPLAERARAALYTAPCDLDAARAAVNAYQDAVARLTATTARDGLL